MPTSYTGSKFLIYFKPLSFNIFHLKMFLSYSLKMTLNSLIPAFKEFNHSPLPIAAFQ